MRGTCPIAAGAQYMEGREPAAMTLKLGVAWNDVKSHRVRYDNEPGDGKSLFNTTATGRFGDRTSSLTFLMMGG